MTEARMPKCVIERVIYTWVGLFWDFALLIVIVSLFWDYRSINSAVTQTFFSNHHFIKTASKTRLIGQKPNERQKAPWWLTTFVILFLFWVMLS